MKKSTHKLLKQAHSIITDATGTDVPKTVRAEAYKKVRHIYKRIKKLDMPVWTILNEDDNHKTKKRD